MPEDEDWWYRAYLKKGSMGALGLIEDVGVTLAEYSKLTTQQLHARLDALIAQEESNG